MLALFGAPPPQATQTLPRLSLCRHACANTVCELRALPSLPSSSGTSTRSAASGIGGGGGGDGGGDDDNDGG